MNQIKSWITGHGAIHAICVTACIILPLGYLGFALFLGQNLGDLLSGSLLLPLLLCGAMHLLMHRMMGHGHASKSRQELPRVDATPMESWEVSDPATAEEPDRSFEGRRLRSIDPAGTRGRVPVSVAYDSSVDGNEQEPPAPAPSQVRRVAP